MKQDLVQVWAYQVINTSPGKDSVARHDFQEVWTNCQSAKHAYVYVSFLLCNNRDSINIDKCKGRVQKLN